MLILFDHFFLPVFLLSVSRHSCLLFVSFSEGIVSFAFGGLPLRSMLTRGAAPKARESQALSGESAVYAEVEIVCVFQSWAPRSCSGSWRIFRYSKRVWLTVVLWEIVVSSSPKGGEASQTVTLYHPCLSFSLFRQYVVLPSSAPSGGSDLFNCSKRSTNRLVAQHLL